MWLVDQYPAGKPNVMRPSFAELLEKSLCKQEDMRAWCNHCRTYVSLQQVICSTLPPNFCPVSWSWAYSSKFSLALLGARCSPHYVLVSCSLDKVGLQTRFPCSVPDILIVNCCIQREADLYYWFADGDYTTTSDSSKFATSSTTTNSSRPISSGSQAVRSNWLPFHIEIAVDPVTFSVTVTEVYLLVMLVSYIYFILLLVIMHSRLPRVCFYSSSSNAPSCIGAQVHSTCKDPLGWCIS